MENIPKISLKVKGWFAEDTDITINHLDVLAHHTESAERYEDMCEVMGELVKQKKARGLNLSVDERNMLSVAYKNVVGSKRASWRQVKQEIDQDDQPSHPALSKKYKGVIETELQGKCDEVLGLLNNKLIATDLKEKWLKWHDEAVKQKQNGDKEKEVKSDDIAKAVRKLWMTELKTTDSQTYDQCDDWYNKRTEDERKKAEVNARTGVNNTDLKKPTYIDNLETEVETLVFYLKMCGDYYRYLAEFQESNDAKKNANNSYNLALKVSYAGLAPTHPTRLGLALNASVCYYEIMNEPKLACQLAKSAFDDAISRLDSLSDSTYKDSTLIMQLLRDNLTIWTSQDGNDNDEK